MPGLSLLDHHRLSPPGLIEHPTVSFVQLVPQGELFWIDLEFVTLEFGLEGSWEGLGHEKVKGMVNLSNGVVFLGLGSKRGMVLLIQNWGKRGLIVFQVMSESCVQVQLRVSHKIDGELRIRGLLVLCVWSEKGL